MTPPEAGRGGPLQLARLLDALAETVEAEPGDVFSSTAVQNSALHLCRLLQLRVIESRGLDG